jgi:sigma-E factor negative regulatory protein RseB
MDRGRFMMKHGVWVLFLFGLSFSLQANEAIRLLNQMSLAVHNLDYHGKLVFSQQGDFELLGITHVVENGVAHEQVEKLDGNENKKIVKLDTKTFSFSDFPQINEKMLEAYSFDLGKESEIAGNRCLNVFARPKDRMRYLHHYCINPDNGMLMSYALVNNQRKAVEKMVFTEINFEKKTIADNKEGDTGTYFNPFKLEREAVEEPLSWQFEALPKGFFMNQVLRSHNSDVQNDTSHEKSDFIQIIFTDRVASVSVFVEPQLNKSENPELDINRKEVFSEKQPKGAINNLTVKKSGHILTAIGDVPESTLRSILQGARYVSE